MHPDYDDWELDYDISLFFLSSPLNIDGASTALIPLPTQSQNVEDGASALVTGWGSTQVFINLFFKICILDTDLINT